MFDLEKNINFRTYCEYCDKSDLDFRIRDIRYRKNMWYFFIICKCRYCKNTVYNINSLYNKNFEKL